MSMYQPLTRDRSPRCTDRSWSIRLLEHDSLDSGSNDDGGLKGEDLQTKRESLSPTSSLHPLNGLLYEPM